MKGTRREWLALVALCGLANMGFAAQPMAQPRHHGDRSGNSSARGAPFLSHEFHQSKPFAHRDRPRSRSDRATRRQTSGPVFWAHGRCGSYVVPTGQSHAVNFDFQSNGAFNWSQWSPLTIEWGRRHGQQPAHRTAATRCNALETSALLRRKRGSVAKLFAAALVRRPCTQRVIDQRCYAHGHRGQT